MIKLFCFHNKSIRIICIAVISLMSTAIINVYAQDHGTTGGNKSFENSFETQQDSFEKFFMDQIEKNPESEDAYTNLIFTLIIREKYAKAKIFTEKFLSVNPENPFGQMYKKYLNKIEAATDKDVKKSLREEFKREYTRISDSLHEKVLKKIDETNEILGNHSPDSSDGIEKIWNKTLTKFKENYPDICEYEQKKKKRDTNLWLTVNNIEREEGAQGLRIKYPQLIAENPESANLYRMYGQLLIQDGNYTEAENIINTGLDLDPYDMEIVLLRDFLLEVKPLPTLKQKRERYNDLLINFSRLNEIRYGCENNNTL